jgi:hypothetical protein
MSKRINISVSYCVRLSAGKCGTGSQVGLPSDEQMLTHVNDRTLKIRDRNVPIFDTESEFICAIWYFQRNLPMRPEELGCLPSSAWLRPSNLQPILTSGCQTYRLKFLTKVDFLNAYSAVWNLVIILVWWGHHARSKSLWVLLFRTDTDTTVPYPNIALGASRCLIAYLAARNLVTFFWRFSVKVDPFQIHPISSERILTQLLIGTVHWKFICGLRLSNWMPQKYGIWFSFLRGPAKGKPFQVALGSAIPDRYWQLYLYWT